VEWTLKTPAIRLNVLLCTTQSLLSFCQLTNHKGMHGYFKIKIGETNYGYTFHDGTAQEADLRWISDNLAWSLTGVLYPSNMQ
jgi:hypothetical protein